MVSNPRARVIPVALRLLSIAASCSFLAFSPATPSDETAAATAIRAAYEALRDAFLKNDAAALSALLAPDFYQRETDGRIETREAFIKDETDNTPGLTVSSGQFIISQLAVRGNAAEAQTTYTYAGTYAVAGVAKALRGIIYFTDDWTVEGGTWKLRSSAMHHAIAYVSGKLVLDHREQVAPTNAAIGELRKRAVVIPTFALDADPDQFARIGAYVGNARIVGMGEGSHGTSEFFAFKNRLFKYLVEKKGFTVFAMEAYWGVGLGVDRYIKTSRGTARQAVASLAFWTWDAPEVVDLIQWMRDFNARPGRHPILTFASIDMQNPMGAIGYLANYLRLRDRGEVAAARPALQCASDATSRYRAKPTATCRAQVAAIGTQLASLQNDPDATIAQHAVTNILQYLDWKIQPEDARLALRDRDMAKNVEWLATTYPRAKIAVWAHNGHIDASGNELSYQPMGTYLRQRFGRDYYTIGQTFGSGTVRAIVIGHGLQTATVPANPNDTIVALFAPLNVAAFVDLRGLVAGSALQTFFSTQRSIEEIGATIDPQQSEDQKLAMVVPNSFDGLVFVPTSTAATSGTRYSEMRREVRDGSVVWEISGVGFDDVTSSTTANNATLRNDDPLNAAPNTLERRFDARPYAGQTVQVSGEVQREGLVGFVYPYGQAVAANNSVLLGAQGDPITSTSNAIWAPFSVKLKVPQNADFIDAGFWSVGLGTVEVRDLEINASTGANK